MFMSPIKLKVKSYKTESGSEPVREWLKQLDVMDKKLIGADIKQFNLAGLLECLLSVLLHLDCGK